LRLTIHTLLLTGLGIIVGTVFVSAVTNYLLMDQLRGSLQSVRKTDLHIQEKAEQLRHIVSVIERTALQAALERSDFGFMAATTESNRFFTTTQEIERVLNADQDDLRELLMTLKTDYRTFMASALSMFAEYVEGRDLQEERLEKMRRKSNSFGEHLDQFVEMSRARLKDETKRNLDIANQSMRIFIGLAALTGVVLIGFLAVLEFNLRRPVNRLVRFLHKVTESPDSHLTARLSMPGKDEVSYIGKAIDTMLEELEKSTVSHNELEVQVKERTSELKSSEERFRSISTSSSVAMIVASDYAGRVISWNPAAEKAFGYCEEEILGRPLTDIMPERYKAAHTNGLQRAVEKGDYHAIGTTLNLYALKKNGEEFPIELSLGTWEQDGEKYFSAVIHDITERKRDEKKLKEAKEQSEIANQAKSEFLSAMSHDLRTPLNAIMGFSDMMRMKTFGPLGNEHYEQYVDDIHGSGSLLISLINDVLDLSKIEAGKYELVDEQLDISSTIKTSFRQLKNMAETNNQSLTYDIPSDTPALLADERALDLLRKSIFCRFSIFSQLPVAFS
jgi:PAS domain S-box-containing protein